VYTCTCARAAAAGTHNNTHADEATSSNTHQHASCEWAPVCAKKKHFIWSRWAAAVLPETLVAVADT